MEAKAAFPHVQGMLMAVRKNGFCRKDEKLIAYLHHTSGGSRQNVSDLMPRGRGIGSGGAALDRDIGRPEHSTVRAPLRAGWQKMDGRRIPITRVSCGSLHPSPETTGLEEAGVRWLTATQWEHFKPVGSAGWRVDQMKGGELFTLRLPISRNSGRLSVVSLRYDQVGIVACT